MMTPVTTKKQQVIRMQRGERERGVRAEATFFSIIFFSIDAVDALPHYTVIKANIKEKMSHGRPNFGA
jgi:hypothetical protein